MARFERSSGRDSRGGSSRGRPSRGNSSGRRSFDDGPSFEDRPRSRFGGGRGGDRGGRPEMHDVVCDKCGKECQVPFRPTSSKPVFCSDCFEKEDSRGGDRRGGDRRGGSSRSGPSSNDLDIINEKLNKIMKALKIEDKPKKEKKVKEVEEESEDEDQSEEDQEE
jgi:CxxC-x17-CxxC domain-containing protein